MTHKHATIIRQWAEEVANETGATIETRYPCGSSMSEWTNIACPTWELKCEYRIIKPDVVYWNAIYKDGFIGSSCESVSSVMREYPSFFAILKLRIPSDGSKPVVDVL